MIKVEVIEEFTYSKFNEIKDSIVRKDINKQKDGYLYVGDIFECSIDTASYLTKTNPLGRAFVKIIETIPEERPEVKKEVVIKEMKPVKKATKKTTTKKKK